MLFLISSALLLSVYSLVFKLAHRRGCDVLGVTGGMMAVGAVLSLIYLVLRVPLRAIPLPVINLGIIAGMLFFIAVITFFEVTRRGRLAISWTVLSLSLVIPTLASMILWGETPFLRQCIGMGGIAAAFVLFGIDQNRVEARRNASSSEGWIWALLLFIAFISTGLTLVCTKAMIEQGLTDFLLHYTLIDYASAATLAITFIWVKKRMPGHQEWKMAILMGISGFASFILLLEALLLLSGIVVFPLRSTINIVLTASLSVVLWREKMTVAGGVGMALAIVSIFLIP